MTSVVEFVAALAGLILLHESGHFLACRLFDIEVEEFGLGFPPRLTTLFEHRGTKFTLNAIPLGGFVRPRGEGDPNIEGSIEAASPWARLGVYVAGPLMNFLLGVLLLTFAVWVYGIPMPQDEGVQVLQVMPNSPASETEIQACDYILAINGQPIKQVEDVIGWGQRSGGQELEITLVRGGQQYVVTLVPRLNPPPGEGAMGIMISQAAEVQRVSFGVALLAGTATAAQSAVEMAKMPVTWLRQSDEENTDRLVGLKGMYDIYETSRSGDLVACTSRGTNILVFLASISISLAVLNLFPLPSLDGGRILFVMPEIILKKRIPPRYEMWVNMLGFFLLLGLLVWINIQDFINPLY